MTVTLENLDAVLKNTEEGIAGYLHDARSAGQIDEQLYRDALNNTFPNLKNWLTDDRIDGISPNLKKGVMAAIENERWEDLVNAFRQAVRFGTGGIRGMMAFDKASIVKMKEQGVEADFLRGTNTINDLVVLLTSAGVARYGRAQSRKLEKIVIGYDSRIRGHDFGRLVAELFLAYDYTVYFFDAPCPYPEVTFAIPNEAVKADVGVLISASHNDYRYNGYKLSCANGSQFDPEERDEMYNEYIKHASTADIKRCSFADAAANRLWFLGGGKPVDGYDYCGREDRIINMHARHRDHIKSFLVTENLARQQKSAADPLHIAFCPFHGAGKVAVPRLLSDVGFVDVKSVNGTKSGLGLNELNGLFPAFRSEPGKEQQPDPGDPRAARTAVRALKEDYPDEFRNVDLLIGTDPDADRCGIVVPVPENQREIYDNQDWYLLPADDVWTLVVWYGLHCEAEKHGQVTDAEKKFVVLSHTTSDAITCLARKHGLGVIKSWVGFAALAAVTRDTWDGRAAKLSSLVDGRDETYTDLCHPFVCESFDMDKGTRSINIAAMEQSNGFSILGGPPPDRRSLGVQGHVRDKDGTFAAVLVAEIAAWAKAQGTDIIGLLDKYIYVDSDIGLFATFYEPDPLDGEYPGIQGDRIKKNILRRALGYYQMALAGDLDIAGHRVHSAAMYRTGKYDRIYPPSYDYLFPDEGIRFFFSQDRLQHLTIRPSGTGNSLRFHIQLHAKPSESNLLQTKRRLRQEGKQIMDRLREMLKAPREL